MNYLACFCLLLIIFSQSNALRKKVHHHLKTHAVCSAKQATTNFSFTNGWTSFNVSPRILGDINGDGLKDIIAFGNDGVRVALSNGDGTFAAPVFALNNYGVNAGGWETFDKYPRAACDVNGDGRDDIVGFGDQYVWVALSNGKGFDTPYSGTSAFSYKAGWSSQNITPRLCFDMDGDFKADIVGFWNDGVYISYGDGQTFPQGQGSKVLSDMSVNAGGWTSFDKFPRCVGRFGCGAASIIGFGDAGVYVSSPQSKTSYSPVVNALKDFVNSVGWASYDKYPRFCADLNGDGIVDIAAFGDQYVFAGYGDKNGKFSSANALLQNFVYSSGGWSSFDKFPRAVGKVYNDRLSASLVGFGNEWTFTAC